MLGAVYITAPLSSGGFCFHGTFEEHVSLSGRSGLVDNIAETFSFNSFLFTVFMLEVFKCRWDKVAAFPPFDSFLSACSPRAPSLLPGEGHLRFVISFVFKVLLVDSSGSFVPLLASRSRHWPAVVLQCHPYGA